jgi:hypothetical protein
VQAAKGGAGAGGRAGGGGVAAGGRLAKARAAKGKAKTTTAVASVAAEASVAADADAVAPGGAEGVGDFAPDEWHVVRSAAGVAPSPRSHHLFVAVDRNRAMVVGGRARGGALLADVRILDLRAMSWAKAQPTPFAVAGGAWFEWDARLMVLSGFPAPAKAEEDTSYFGAAVGSLDTSYFGVSVGSLLSFGAAPPQPEKARLLEYHRASREWSEVTTSGLVPITKGGVTATVVCGAGGQGPGLEKTKKHNTLVVYGGEGGDGQFYSTVSFLNLDDMTWSLPVLGGPSPGARAHHTALLASDAEEQLVFFGGRNKSGVVQPAAALAAMDLKRRRWVDVEVAGTAPPAAARSGHCSVHVRKTWTHISGLGAAAGDTVAVDLETCSWVTFPGAAADMMPPVGGATCVEGRALVVARYNPVTRRGVLLTFGGVDRSGRFVDNLHVLNGHELNPTFTKLPEPERAGGPIVGWSNDDERRRVEGNRRAMATHPLLENDDHRSSRAEDDEDRRASASAPAPKEAPPAAVGVMTPEELEVFPEDDHEDVVLKFQLAQREWELANHVRNKEHKAALKALRESCERDSDRRARALQDDVERAVGEADRRRARLRDELEALEQAQEEKFAKAERALGAREAEIEELEAALVMKNNERQEEMDGFYRAKEATLREEVDDDRADLMHKIEKQRLELEKIRKEDEQKFEAKTLAVFEDVRKTAEQRDQAVKAMSAFKAEAVQLTEELKAAKEALDLASVQLRDDDMVGLCAQVESSS